MLLIQGKTLGVTREIRGPQGSQFEQVEIHLLDGMKSQAVRVARNYDQTTLPKEGDTVVLEVSVSAYATRSGGAAPQVTALARRTDLEDLFDSDRPFLSAVNES